MSRQSNDHYDIDGRLIQGYDYTNQAWVFEGMYETCGHPEEMDCQCYGKEHAGEQTAPLEPGTFSHEPEATATECDLESDGYPEGQGRAPLGLQHENGEL